MHTVSEIDKQQYIHLHYYLVLNYFPKLKLECHNKINYHLALT